MQKNMYLLAFFIISTIIFLPTISVFAGDIEEQVTSKIENFGFIEEDAVFDKNTGLLWSYAEPKKLRFFQANKFCSKLELLGFKDWELPSSTQIKTVFKNIDNWNKNTPIVREDIFPNHLDVKRFWLFNVADDWRNDDAYAYNILKNKIANRSKTGKHHVWCVRIDKQLGYNWYKAGQGAGNIIK